MGIDRAEIERILDDFNTKAEQAHEEAKQAYGKSDYQEVVCLDQKSHAFEYAAAVLKQVL